MGSTDHERSPDGARFSFDDLVPRRQKKRMAMFISKSFLFQNGHCMQRSCRHRVFL